MGGTVPKGQNNEELVDNLVEANCINKPENIKAFRAVDRGDFYPGEYLEDSYKDMPKKVGNLHISAPCIYCKMLENMELKPGMSFLNIGSGTGYLSTLIGLLLGENGTNHGIEIFQDVIEYANKKIDEFIRFGDGFDYYHFKRPTFVQGNLYCLDTDFRKYDRVYCGAGVPDEKTKSMLKNLIGDGGILIIPYEDNLMKYKRLSMEDWEESAIMNVNFCNLIEEREEDTKKVKIYTQPQSLKQMSRTSILKCILQREEGNVKDVEQLPIPKVLIRFLKYYRDENVQKPESTKKRRTKKRKMKMPDDEDGAEDDNSDSSFEDDDQIGHIRFQVVLH